MDSVEILLPMVILVFIIYTIAKKIKEVKLVDEMLQEYYNKNYLKVLNISNLNFTEKIKYGVSVSPFFKIYTTTFGVLTNAPNNYFRKIETSDSSEKEQIRYVEISFSPSGFDVKEFDIFEF